MTDKERQEFDEQMKKFIEAMAEAAVLELQGMTCDQMEAVFWKMWSWNPELPIGINMDLFIDAMGKFALCARAWSEANNADQLGIFKTIFMKVLRIAEDALKERGIDGKA